MLLPMSRTHAWAGIAATGLVLALAAACTNGSQSRPGTPGYPPGSPAGVVGARPTEGYVSPSPRVRSAGLLRLPGFPVQQLVKYDLVDGLAVMEGDIVLGPASMLPLRYGLPAAWGGATVKGAVAMSDKSYLWPGGVIPYEIDSSNSASTVQSIQWAVAEVSKTELELRPRTAAESDYVVFRDTGNGCTSYVGRIGGAQTISTTGCGKGSLAHEILHAAGFYHEQSRSDRDAYVTINFDNIADGYEDNFEKRTQNAVDIGQYDYGSIMHYDGYAFSKNGKPTIVPLMPNASIGQREGLSLGDKAAVTQLYGGGPGGGTTVPATGGYAGSYSSQQGSVSCTQTGVAVQCTFSTGSLWCTANGDELGCAWTGSAGQGRAVFRRQATGVLAGTWGDGLSADSRGAWDLTPSGPAPTQPAPGGTFPLPWPTGSLQLPFPVPTGLPSGLPSGLPWPVQQ